ncbi:hypothetical protein [Kutzneria sp. CA-103260]|uniref:hypothetical protein n=1 Tax=Kutzneria sp. CA-103260 TaxID=2802641 RepID=UPI001BA7B3B8|nr:hypothetical protein [Kutzneria sp. CA-103260]QUQ69615.1 Copper chaperone PCu(A)C [Kutzneria sp. CA-103260]
MSSGEQNLITRLRLLPAVLGIGAAILVSGCSAGQITQTDTQVPAINGSMGTVKQIAVRDAQLAFPTAKRFYGRGDNAAVIVTIANSGQATDKLTGVSSPQFGSGQIIGDATIPGFHAIAASATAVSPLATTTATSAPATSTSSTGTSTSGSTSTSTSTSASSTSTSATSTSAADLPVGTIRIQLVGLNVDKIQPGQTVQVTFTFANAGDLTLTLPIAADKSARVDN